MVRILDPFPCKKWGNHGRVPTKEDLQKATYIEKGRAWRTNRLRAVAPEDDPYNKELLIQDYINYNKTVQEYFRHRPGDLLILNVAESDAYEKLTNFLGIETDPKEFPWEKKT